MVRTPVLYAHVHGGGPGGGPWPRPSASAAGAASAAAAASAAITPSPLVNRMVSPFLESGTNCSSPASRSVEDARGDFLVAKGTGLFWIEIAVHTRSR